MLRVSQQVVIGCSQTVCWHSSGNDWQTPV